LIPEDVRTAATKGDAASTAPRSARLLLVVGKATLAASALTYLVAFTGHILWPLALIALVGGFLGVLMSIVVLTRTHDHKLAKRGAFFCVVAFLLAVPFLWPVG
jgi:uncharacterized membrane protein YfcA